MVDEDSVLGPDFLNELFLFSVLGSLFFSVCGSVRQAYLCIDLGAR